MLDQGTEGAAPAPQHGGIAGWGADPGLAEAPSRWWKRTWNDKARRLGGQPAHVVDGNHFLTEAQYQALVRRVTAPLHVQPGQRILECGCGAGAFLQALRSVEPQLQLAGVDVCEPMVDLARRSVADATFAVCDAQDLTAIPSSSFDQPTARTLHEG